MKKAYGWYFSETSLRLQRGDYRKVTPGITHTVNEADLSIYKYGLHASKRLLDALYYALGPYVWRVRLSGRILSNDDTLCASNREYLWGYDASEVLSRFARNEALRVIHRWDAPDIVVNYLETGRESLRVEAAAAIWSRIARAASVPPVTSATNAAIQAARWAVACATPHEAVWMAAHAAAWALSRPDMALPTKPKNDSYHDGRQNRAITQMIVKNRPGD